MQIKCKLDKEDIINFNIYQYSMSASVQDRIKKIRLIGPAIFMLAAIVAMVATDLPKLLWVISFCICSVFWYLTYPNTLNKQIRRNVDKMLNEGDNKSPIGESLITISKDGIVKKGEYKETKLSWSSVDKISINDKYIFIYDSSVSAIIINRENFSSTQEEKTFVDTLNQLYKK